MNRRLQKFESFRYDSGSIPPTATQLAAAGAVMQDGSTAITAPQQGVPGVGPNDFATVSQVDAAAIPSWDVTGDTTGTTGLLGAATASASVGDLARYLDGSGVPTGETRRLTALPPSVLANWGPKSALARTAEGYTNAKVAEEAAIARAAETAAKTDAIAAAKTYTDAQVAAALAPANTQVNASRAFASSDNLATLEIVGNVTLTNPTGLPAGWRCNALIVGAFACVVGTGAGDTTVKNFSGALQFAGDGAMGTFMLDSGGRIVWNADGI